MGGGGGGRVGGWWLWIGGGRVCGNGGGWAGGGVDGGRVLLDLVIYSLQCVLYHIVCGVSASLVGLSGHLQ